MSNNTEQVPTLDRSAGEPISTSEITSNHSGVADLPRVVIIGSGFGGLFAAQALKRAAVQVTLIAKTNHHLFQPLLYQVATGILSQGAIAPPTREILRSQRNVEVLLGEVTDIDLNRKVVAWWTPAGTTEARYDYLIVAAGSGQSYFGNDQIPIKLARYWLTLHRMYWPPLETGCQPRPPRSWPSSVSRFSSARW